MANDSKQVEVQLDAVHPEELMKEPTPVGVWLRVDELDGPGGGWPVMSITGDLDAVKSFIDDHWGLDSLPDWDELTKETA